MSDLMISKQLPPAIPKRIVQFLIVTDKTLKETRADLLAIKQLEAGSDRYYALLRDAQRLDELKTLAELMLGQILKKMEKNKGGRPSKTCRTRRQVTLKDQKIGRDLSSESQLMASNEKVVYETIEKLRDTDNPYIHAAVIRQIRVGQRRPAKLPPLPEGKYTVLLADPPWPQSGKSAMTLTVDEICELGVGIKKIADDGCLLFLWVPAPMLGSFRRVIDAWGFRYGGQLIWIKDDKDSGSIRHENLILAGKDRAALSVITKEVVRRVDSVQLVDELGTDAKATVVNDVINGLSLKGDRLALFAKADRNGWENWSLSADSLAELDPCCGSGTLIFDCVCALPPLSLTHAA
jgi:N6-adenosine-specific RNA methylase IME4